MAPEKNDGTECAAAPEAPPVATTTAVAAEDNGAANLSTVSVDSTNGEHDPYFEPVVSLPAEVIIKSNEEDEEEVYKGRCKVFRYVHDTSEGGEWKERGTGDVKLLKNTEKETVRLIMRQEKTLKVRANHYLTPYMKLRPNCDSDRAFVWYVMFDFADEEPKSEMFAIRFANAENARVFKEAFEEAVAYITSTVVALVSQMGQESDIDEDDDDDDDEEEEEKESENKEEEKASTSEADSKTESEVVESLEKLKVDERSTGVPS